MKVQIVQHIACEGPGYLEDFLHGNGIEYEIARMYEGEQLPDNFDALIVLGGPMKVYEEERSPYLKRLNTTIKNVRHGVFSFGMAWRYL
jgi:GMP synthase (glutamine-hydrolysing)